MSNTNVNQTAVQVIFPEGVELRRIKKKKRKSPSVNKKKALIKELKELLQAYDQEIEAAKEKNIKLPAELGELPKDIKEMKTVKQLELLIDEIKSKILKIQALIRNGSVANRSNELFGVAPRPMGIGSFPIPQQQPVPIQPQILPSPIIPVQPRQPVIIPQPVRPSVDVGSKLDALEAEILKNLDPNDPATKKIIEQINERKKRPLPIPPIDPNRPLPIPPIDPNRPLPPTPVDPNRPLPPTPVQPTPVQPTPVKPSPLPENLNLETVTGDRVEALGFSGKRFTLSAPIPKNNISWFNDISEPFNRYVDDLKFWAKQLRPGEFHISIEDNNKANKMRQDILDKYNEWLGDLSPAQRNFVDTHAGLRLANSQIFTSVSISPRDLLFDIYSKKNIPNLKVTAGDTHPEIEEMIEKSKKGLDSDASAFAARVRKQITIWNNEAKFLKKRKNETEYLNKLSEKEILSLRDGYDRIFMGFNKDKQKLSPIEQASTITVFEELQVSRDNVQRHLNDRWLEIQRLKESDPAAAKKAEEAAEKPAMIDPLPVPEQRQVIGTDGGSNNKDLVILIKYVDNISPYKLWTTKVQEAYENVFDWTVKSTTELPAGNAKRPIIRKMIQQLQKSGKIN